jgi:chemotaxis signal transduction protein
MNFPAENYGNFKGILAFKLGEMEFCCDLQSIINILKTDEIRRGQQFVFKNSKTVIYDKTKFRLINLNRILHAAEAPFEELTRLILLEAYSKKIAFFVDQILEIYAVENILLDKSIELKPVVNIKYGKYCLVYHQKTMIWPDYEKICKDIDRLPGVDWQIIKLKYIIQGNVKKYD